jgi:hypothetical protein
MNCARDDFMQLGRDSITEKLLVDDAEFVMVIGCQQIREL